MNPSHLQFILGLMRFFFCKFIFIPFFYYSPSVGENVLWFSLFVCWVFFFFWSVNHSMIPRKQYVNTVINYCLLVMLYCTLRRLTFTCFKGKTSQTCIKVYISQNQMVYSGCTTFVSCKPIVDYLFIASVLAQLLC